MVLIEKDETKPRLKDGSVRLGPAEISHEHAIFTANSLASPTVGLAFTETLTSRSLTSISTAIVSPLPNTYQVKKMFRSRSGYRKTDALHDDFQDPPSLLLTVI